MSFPSSAWLGERKPVRRRLSAEAIVAAGLEILAADGLDAVTMRAVAGKLDTGAASLYAHVKDKNELHLLMLDEVIGEVEVPEPADPERWQAQVKEFCRNAYAALTRHPGMASVNIGTIPTGPKALRTSEALLKILLAGGLSKPVVGLAIDLVTLYPTAVAFEDTIWRARAGAPADAAVTEQTVVGQIDAYFRSLPEDLFPTVRMMAPFLTAGDGNLRFEFGLSVLVAGLAALKDWSLEA